MKPKIIRIGALLFLAAAILVLDAGKEFPPTSVPPLTPADAREQPRNNTVTANDEGADSTAWQTTSANQANSQTSHNPKKTATAKPEKIVTINNKQYPLRIYEPLGLPNDPQVSQWWVTNTKLDQAWDIPRGDHETVLAIIDTGFAIGHEEFANRWYSNPGESGAVASQQPSALNCADRGLSLNASCNRIDDDRDEVVDNESGPAAYQNPSGLNCSDQGRPLTKDCNRIDDDGNGYIDDSRGWDFINFDHSVQAGELNPSGSGTTHGTLVAGVAAASGNNSKGLAGADWATKILPLQALDDDSYGDTLSVGQAIFYAAAQGADVISLSLGSVFPDDYVQEAVQAAIEAGSVVVAASGNGGCECMVYPANYPEVVAVGALGSNGQPANFSAWGANLDILAPGAQINSASWQSGNPTSAYKSGVNGTSFATPIISGMLTRLLSHQPQATPLQLIAALAENTNRLSISPQTPHNIKLGYGSLDALKATSRMLTAQNLNSLHSFTSLSRGNHLTPQQPSESVAPYIVYDCQPGKVAATPIYELVKSGSHFFSISKAEMEKAKASGHSSALFAHACLQQPHDTADDVRSLNLFSEFRNIYPKP